MIDDISPSVSVEALTPPDPPKPLGEYEIVTDTPTFQSMIDQLHKNGEFAFDTETTGLSHKTGDRVIEVGCVELVNHVATNKALQFYCNVEKEI